MRDLPLFAYMFGNETLDIGVFLYWLKTEKIEPIEDEL